MCMCVCVCVCACVRVCVCVHVHQRCNRKPTAMVDRARVFFDSLVSGRLCPLVMSPHPVTRSSPHSSLFFSSLSLSLSLSGVLMRSRCRSIGDPTARTDYATCALTKIHPDDFVRATASSFEIPSGSPACPRSDAPRGRKRLQLRRVTIS